MELVRVLSLCLLTWSGSTSAQGQVVVKEDSDVVLPCSLSSQENLVSKLFDWRKVGQRKKVFMYDAGLHYNNGRTGQDEQFKGRVSHFPDQLKFGNASIKITKTKAADSGSYTCDFPHLQPRQTFNIELVVECFLKNRCGDPDHKGVCQKPSIAIPSLTPSSAVLQCAVRGASIEPTVEWQDSSGNILRAETIQDTVREQRYDVTIQTTVDKTDNYTCVVTQKNICHQINATTEVHIGGLAPVPSVTILDQTDDGLILECLVREASPKTKVCWQDSSGKVLQCKDPQITQRENIILQHSVTKSDRYTCVVTQQETSGRTNATIYAPIDSGFNTGLVITIVVLIILLLSSVAFGFWAYFKRQNTGQPEKGKENGQTEFELLPGNKEGNEE